MLLTIGILSVPERLGLLSEALGALQPQMAGRANVELLVLTDNQTRSVGSKRNAIVDLARGQYIAFVDDDDLVKPDYIQSILGELSKPPLPDIVCFEVELINHIAVPNGKRAIYRLRHSHSDRGDVFLRQPNHLMAWSKAIASCTPFDDVDIGEDTTWAIRASAKAKNERCIDRVLYTYRGQTLRAKPSVNQTSSVNQAVQAPVAPEVLWKGLNDWISEFERYEKEEMLHLRPIDAAAVRSEHERFRALIAKGQGLNPQEMNGHVMWKHSLRKRLIKP